MELFSAGKASKKQRVEGLGALPKTTGKLFIRQQMWGWGCFVPVEKLTGKKAANERTSVQDPVFRLIFLSVPHPVPPLHCSEALVVVKGGHTGEFDLD
jgi:hypothetical protein